MKKTGLIYVFAIISLLYVGLVGASGCNLDVSLLNQDPYPAVQGDYVKLVFQIDGLENEECGDVYFELSKEFPIEFDPGSSNSVVLKSRSYILDYNNYALVPFNVRLNSDALGKNYEIKLRYSIKYGAQSPLYVTKKFNLTLEDYKTDFEVSFKDYDFTKQIATFEIINVGKQDVRALTVDIFKQDNFIVKGSTRSIIGSLDMNEDTSFTFEGVPRNGEIKIRLSYNDNQDVRRTIEKSAYYDSELFTGRVKDIVKPNYNGYIVLGIIVILLIFWIISRIRRKRRLEKLREMRK